jgi:hypothetical protein
MLTSRRGAFQSALVGSAASLLAAQTAAASEGGDKAAASAGFVNAKDFSAVGDGKTNDTAALQAAIDECFGPATNPHSGSNAHFNKPLYIPPGSYRITAPLLLTNVRGGHIFGAGRFATSIVNVAGTSVLRTNGFEFNRVEMLRLSTAGRTADVLDLDWTHTGGTALQSNTFADMRFDGGGIGANIGKSDYMGSENLFLNCFFGPHATAGLRTSNFNALQNTLIGGNVQSCPIGVWVRMGSCSIYNTGFQVCNTFDIMVDNSANDTMVVSGSRSESPNFIQLRNGITALVVGCSHLGGMNGTFADIGGCHVTIDSCVSSRGIVKGYGAIRTVNSSFGRSDWFDAGSMRWGANEVQNCYAGGTPNVGFDKANFVAHTTFTPAGPQWPSRRMSLVIGAGSRRAQTEIAAGTRILAVTLILDKPGSAGTVSVGDTGNTRRYFDRADLAGQTLVSPVIEYRYDAASTLIVESTNAAGAAASVAVDFVIET